MTVHTTIRTVVATAVLAMVSAGGGQAHHSPAMFDQERQITLSGTVRSFQWTSPHCYVQLLVTNEAGQEEEWSLEMGAPIYLYNQGWRPSTLQPGDRLTVTINPLRNGSRGGLLLEAKTPDGKPVEGGVR